MDVEIFVHGIPHGQSFWGEEEDRNYFGNFYDQSCSDAVKYLIQTRSSNGKNYCYYNYFVYQNVIGNDNRRGSYFGLSIRFDAYCKDFIGIYKILDVVFTAYVLNKILKVNNGNYKYDIVDFVGEPEMMSNIKDAIWQLLKTTLTQECFCDLRGFAVGGGDTPTGSLYEMTANDVEAAVKKSGKIALSPYYPTNREKSLAQQYDSKLQSVKQQYEERYNAEINTKEQKIRSLEDSLTSVKRKCEKFQEEIAHRDSKIKQIGQIQKAEQIINQIKAPIIDLSNILGGQRVHGRVENTKQKKVRGLIPLVNLAILLLVLIVVVLLMFKVSTYENISFDKDLHDSISVLQKENENLKNRLSSFEKVNTLTEQVYNPFSNIKISVNGYDEKKKIYLKKNKEYVVTVINSKNPNDGYWNIDGGDINGDIKGQSVTFIPKLDKNVIITYYNPKGECKSRCLIVKN